MSYCPMCLSIWTLSCPKNEVISKTFFDLGLGSLLSCIFPRIPMGWYRYSFICQCIPRPGDSEVTLSIFASSCHLLLRI